MDEKTHTTFGKVSLILGIISFLLNLFSPIIFLFFWYRVVHYALIFELTISPVFIYLVNMFLLPTAIVAIILGFMARKQGDKYGLIGLILGLMVISIFIIWMIFAAIIYVSNVLFNS